VLVRACPPELEKPMWGRSYNLGEVINERKYKLGEEQQMISHDKKKRIRELYAQGHKKSHIAKMVGVCRQTVNSHISNKRTGRIPKRFKIFKEIKKKGSQSFFAQDIAIASNVSRNIVVTECRYLCNEGLLECKGGKGKTYHVPDQNAFYQFYLSYKSTRKINV